MATKKDMLIKKRSRKLSEILKYSDFVKGSLHEVRRRGKTENSFHLTYKDENQKTHTRYISRNDLKKAEKAIDYMKKVNHIISDISEINLELMKLDD
jgi:hypothetical protein